MTRLIDADALKENFCEGAFTTRGVREIIDNAPTVKVPENEVNCVLTMFGNCSYSKTGCSDCEIKDKIRKALENDPKEGKWVGIIEYLKALNSRVNILESQMSELVRQTSDEKKDIEILEICKKCNSQSYSNGFDAGYELGKEDSRNQYWGIGDER